MAIAHASVRREFRTTVSSEMQIFVRIVNGFKLLTFLTNSTALIVERVLYLSLLSVLMSSSFFWLKGRLI